MRRKEGAEPVAALNRVRLVECGEPLVDMRKVFPDLSVLRAASVPWLRERVASMFDQARRRLPNGYSLGLREAWRSIDRQKLIYDRYFSQLKEEHPEWPYSTLRRQTNRFFAPCDQKAPPGHSTGGALDVWLLSSGGEPFDLSGEGHKFSMAATFSDDLPEETKSLRLVLYEAMTGAGFSNCRDEWWHYSFGDAAWAVRIGKDTCFYGAAAPPHNEYEKQDRKFAKEFAKRRI
ncbi:MAG: hypothetical protein IH851_00325 [Armatimonadetes bacterium]|nr:hypothetical protein [Armatimonadota bacterium]